MCLMNEELDFHPFLCKSTELAVGEFFLLRYISK